MLVGGPTAWVLLVETALIGQNLPATNSEEDVTFASDVTNTEVSVGAPSLPGTAAARALREAGGVAASNPPCDASALWTFTPPLQPNEVDIEEGVVHAVLNSRDVDSLAGWKSARGKVSNNSSNGGASGTNSRQSSVVRGRSVEKRRRIQSNERGATFRY